MLCHDVQALKIYRRLREPQSFGLASKAILKIFYSPENLRVLVATVGQRQDHVIVGLGQSISMTREFLQAPPVGLQNCLIRFSGIPLHPEQDRWTEVEAYTGIIIHQLGYPPFRIPDSRHGVCRVAFGRNPLVPVVVGERGILDLDGLQPGAFPWRLIKMSMDTNESVHQLDLLLQTYNEKGMFG
ncbi:hypothetical protein SBDP1_650007 [Syntrophobacter sp. SbD1]|nr:hypothetical protein SBDP1_650007 [Syntrophobacter sp. SbD1]